MRSDVLKVPHHGLGSSYSPRFMDAVRPGYAVVTANRLDTKVAGLLDGAEVYLSGVDGAVRFELEEDGVRVSRYVDYVITEAGGLSGEIGNIRRLFTVW